MPLLTTCFAGNIKALKGIGLIGGNLFWKGSLAVYFY